MPIVWPIAEAFPQYPLIDGYLETPPYCAARSQPDIGPPKIRMQRTTDYRRFECVLYLNHNQRDELRDFYVYDTLGGTQEFEWLLPRTQSTVSNMLFDGEPESSYVTARNWQDTNLLVSYEKSYYKTRVRMKYLDTVTPGGGTPTWPLVEPPGTNLTYLMGADVISGDMHARRRSAVRPQRLTFDKLLSAADVATFDSFYVDDCAAGARAFESLVIQHLDTTTQYTFAGPVTYATDGAHYRVSCDIEMWS